MTDGGSPFQPGTEEVAVPFRPRGAYAGYRAFGSGDGAVLVKPEITRELRSAAEFATQERRIAGGLLFGRGFADEQGAYLVIDGYLEAGPGENSGDRISGDGADRFTLSAADLRLLREDAARMYSASLEAGWWRTLPALGEFGPQDFVTQAELVGPDGAGLLVYGSGIHWGTAYLGPDGHAADSAGTLVEVAPAPGPGAEAGRAHGPERVDLAAGGTLKQEPGPGRGRAGGAGRAASETGQAERGGSRSHGHAQVGEQARTRGLPRTGDAGRRPARGRRADRRHHRRRDHHRGAGVQRDRRRDHRRGGPARDLEHRQDVAALGGASRRHGCPSPPVRAQEPFTADRPEWRTVTGMTTFLG